MSGLVSSPETSNCCLNKKTSSIVQSYWLAYERPAVKVANIQTSDFMNNVSESKGPCTLCTLASSNWDIGELQVPSETVIHIILITISVFA